MESGAVVVPHYDSMIAKLITHGRDRQEAMARMRRALDEFVIEGIKTTEERNKYEGLQGAFLALDRSPWAREGPAYVVRLSADVEPVANGRYRAERSLREMARRLRPQLEQLERGR